MREDRRNAAPGLKTAVGVTGLLAAVTTGGLLLFTIGEGAGIFVGIAILLGSVLAAALAGRNVAGAVLAVLAVTLAVSGGITLWGVSQIVLAFAADAGPAAPRPNAVVLESATAKLVAQADLSAFRLELTEAELNAVLQDALAEADNPFRRVTVDITNDVDEDGRLDIMGEFRNGRLDVEGTLTTRVKSGRLDVEILRIEVGMFKVPGVARSALEDMIADLADLQTSLAEEGADVQDIVIGDDRIVVTGTNRSDGAIDSSAVVDAIAARVDLGSPDPIEPRYPAGRVNGTAADGDQYYVALGDSLAANVGVDEPRDGYVSKLHGRLEDRGVEYGLRNFGIPGETSGSLLNAGQLDDAVQFGKDNFVRFVTIDIGANDLLGHLTSVDCQEDLAAAACSARIDASLDSYTANIEEIFTTIEAAFPDAVVALLTTYNPFGFGFEDRVRFEAESNAVLIRLNAIAAGAAVRHGFAVADGFGPMRGLATAATHMVDAPPDIHPNVGGFDLLAGALIDALN